MTQTRARLAVTALLGGAVVSLSARQPPAQPPKYQTATSAVVVDVVARDRRGPVVDLTQADFEVFEDGRPQEIATFERRVPEALLTKVGGEAAVGTGARGAAMPRVVVALAWDRLSQEGRALAYKAAQGFVASRQDDELVGVFLVDQALRTVEGYTTDEAKLKGAIERIGGTATTETGRERDALRDSRVAHPSIPVTAGAEFAGGPGSSAPRSPTPGPGADTAAIGAAAVERLTRDVLDRMDRSFRDLQSNIEGQGSMNALLALVDSLGVLPGRKTVVYFCEGLTVAPAVEAKFQSIIAAANRRNVSVYALDAAGLRAHSKQQETARELTTLSTAAVTGIERSDNRKWTEDLEVNEQVLKMDPSASLGLLTGQTGGLLIQNTNDLDRGIERINDDRRHYYVLTYTPTNAALDGTYRKIEVKVKRPGVDIKARRGYVALPANEASPVLTYEGPVLAAIAASPRPAAFAVRAAALSVPVPGNLSLTALVAGFSAEAVTFAEDPTSRTYAGEVTVLARAVDASGRPAAKQSQLYQLTGAIADLPKARAGGMIFFRTPDLPPGAYTVEFGVHDVRGNRASVVGTTLEVPGGGTPVVGSLFIVSRAERLDPKDPAAATHPLAGQGMLLYPSFGEPISKKAQAEIAFALPMVLDPAGLAPTATLELLQKGQSLAQIPLPLDKPDASGRLLQTGRLPSAALPPGTYDLRVTVTAGATKAARTAALTVVE
jgi:VWFA-related protein